MPILIFIFFAVIAGIVGSKRGRAKLGTVLGLILGPLGLLVIFLLPAKTR